MANPAAGYEQPFDMPNLIPPEAAPPASAEEDEGGFSSWWYSDSTQEKFQGMMGVISALGGGLAGIPAGGGDMSSMERAAVRAAAAPGEARKMMHQRRFARHIRSQLATEEDPERRMMLQGALSDPDNAMQYLSAQTPAAREAQAKRIADYEQGYRLDITRMELESKEKIARAKLHGEGARYGLTSFQYAEIQQANERFKNQPEEMRKKIKTDDYWDVALESPEMMKLINKLWTPNVGQLWIDKHGMNPTDPAAYAPRVINLEGDVVVKDPKTGKPVKDPVTGKNQTVSKVDAVTEAIYGKGTPDPDPETDAALAYSVDKFEQRQGDLTTEQVNKVAESLGLSRQDPLDFDPAGPFNTFDPQVPGPVAGPKTPTETEQALASHTPGSIDSWTHTPNLGGTPGYENQRWANPGEMVKPLIKALGHGTGRPGFEDDRSLSDFSNALDAWVAGGLQEDMETYGGVASDIGDSFSRMGGAVTEGVGNFFQNNFSMEEPPAFIGPIDPERQWRYREPFVERDMKPLTFKGNPDAKPSGVKPDTRGYLERKHRKSQILDRKLREKAAERRERERRLGM